MNILITAPSLDSSKNVSGVAVVVQAIIQHDVNHNFFHFLLGRPDKPANKFIWFYQLIRQFVVFPIVLKRNNIDLVHQNLPLDPKGVSREYIINFWCRLIGTPVILHVHGGQFITQGTKNFIFMKLATTLFKQSKKVIVLSELEKRILKENFDFSKALVLPNSVDTSIFNKRTKIQPKNQLTLLYLGRIEKNKGIMELIEALKLLKIDFSFRFVLCGTGPLVYYCITECKKILEDNFEYKGVVSGDEKINAINHSDLFILPSYFEGLPMALLETMAAGVVPIVTNVGSMKHIIKHGINGLHIKTQDPKDLYEKLKYILANPLHYKELSENAKKTIDEQYDIKSYIVQLNMIHQSSLDARKE